MNNQKQFGVWMDNHHAAVVGSENEESDSMKIIAHVKGEATSSNSSENASNNQVKTLQGKFFKEIASHMVNATHIHVTGTGQVQEQFIHFLADSPQFKNSKTVESTSNKMSDDKLVDFIKSKF
ncbi:MAG: hypothetical protein M3Q95_00210 [Bacteroidota bacterium]|nr:hypothetical protein [Bacteroidota bacterium]